MRKWLAVTCALCIVYARGVCSPRGQGAPPCLPKKEAKRIAAARSPSEALLIYAKVANKELSRQKYLIKLYRPWQDYGPLSTGGLGEGELEVASCAYRAISGELSARGTRGNPPKRDLLRVQHELAKGFVHLEDTMALAPPEIDRQLQTTRALLEDAEMAVRRQLHRPDP
jgi:hypothetical protein